ncbi:DeoR/GlpR family DNA-binding transcription regulator [Streptomyces sp. NPDC005573]|uniref:DeoR/GlpR family DNA-binding transcription regulator n=1 Tax=Streptomyces sp. NPDC005573 TaxID=3156890 RepID=UPI0033B062CF
MTAQERLNLILDLVAEEGTARIEDIADRFGVSAATARRDLNTLAEQRLVTRTHGGAVAVGSAYELPLQYKIMRNAPAKLAIAGLAAGLVAPGEVVGLTGGTTTSEIARELGRARHLQAPAGERSLTIVTNALNIAYEMAIRPQVKVVMTGGVARAQSFELVGDLAHSTLAGLLVDWAFIGVDGLHPAFGATTDDEGEASVNRLLARRAKKVVVVADASKMSATAFAHVCDIADLTAIVTETDPPSDIAEAARSAGVEILVGAVAAEAAEA